MFIQWQTVILAAFVLLKPLCGGAVCISWDHGHDHHDHHCHESDVCEHGVVATECEEEDCEQHQDHEHQGFEDHDRAFFAAPDQLNVPAASDELIAEIVHWFAEPAMVGSASRQASPIDGLRAPPPLRAALCVYLT